MRAVSLINLSAGDGRFRPLALAKVVSIQVAERPEALLYLFDRLNQQLEATE